MPLFEGKEMTNEEILAKPFVYVVGKTLADRPEILPERSIFQDDSTGFQHWVIDGKWVQANFADLSTADKPKDCVENTHFHENDTGDDYIFQKGEWHILPKSEPVAEIVDVGKATEAKDGDTMIEQVEREYVSEGGKWVLVKETVLPKG